MRCGLVVCAFQLADTETGDGGESRGRPPFQRSVRGAFLTFRRG
jgi:hypothetical protein